MEDLLRREREQLSRGSSLAWGSVKSRHSVSCSLCDSPDYVDCSGTNLWSLAEVFAGCDSGPMSLPFTLHPKDSSKRSRVVTGWPQRTQAAFLIPTL